MKAIAALLIVALVATTSVANETEQPVVESLTDRTYYPFYKPKAKAGERCGPHRYCKDKLICESHICKIKIGRRCNRYPKYCQSGSICAGKYYKKRCIVPLGFGEKCGYSPFKICKAGLVCRGHKCVKPKIPLGGLCNFKYALCEHGLTCNDVYGYKKCVKFVGLGYKCRPKKLVLCKKGLVCKYGKCVKPKIPLGGLCNFKHAMCEHGLTCTDVYGYKKCVKFVGLGYKCRPKKLELCKKGLVCKYGKCVKPVVPVGGDCLPYGSVCTKGSFCIGKPYKKICVKPSRYGGPCGTPFSFCKGGLNCFHYKCVKPGRKLGEKCGGHKRCMAGLDCKYLRYLRKPICVRVVGKGARCGVPVVCDKGLKCLYGKCKHYYRW